MNTKILNIIRELRGYRTKVKEWQAYPLEIRKLYELASANEQSIGFNLDLWLNECGSFGCLVGNDFLVNMVDRPYLTARGSDFWDIPTLRLEYGISKGEAYFLFYDASTRYVWNSDLNTNIRIRQFRNSQDKEGAVKRIRKFLYYRLHKQELETSRCKDQRQRKLQGIS